MDLNTEVRYVKYVGEKKAKQLAKLGIETMGDLLYFFPRKYIDYTNVCHIVNAPYDMQCVISATVLKISSGVRVKGGKTIFKIICADDTAKITLTYFNAQYTVQKLQVGCRYLFYGKVGGNILNREMLAPIFVEEDFPIKQQPVYHLTQGLSSNMISKYIQNVLEQGIEIPEFIPDKLLQKFNLVDIKTAIKNIHFAKNITDITKAKERLIFDEFLLLQMAISMMGENVEKTTNVEVNDINISDFINSLQFSLTNAQVRVIDDILSGFKSKIVQNRLVQGDVGCGKTVVGVAACYAMWKNGYQSCMMVPTEILAIQHYQTFKKLLDVFGIKIALLTASVKAKERKEILLSLEKGEIDVIIGTHSLINDKVIFKNLGLCITDEQHRFGVVQRTKMSLKGDNPHIIVMSATPIPRTLAMIIYGNMQISVINQMPQGRKKIETYLVGTDKRARMFNFIDKHIQQGRQAYIVLPAIETNENITELQSVKDYFDGVLKSFLPHIKAEMLHGKMKPAQKDEIMTRFKNGQIDVICSTTVVEVGVDVPNAVIMVIENAERYGLSALHQLRGRVGRGKEQSYCILVSDNKSKNVVERLKFLCANQDGFKVSQYDLENRGPGDFFGKRQHGLPDLKIANMAQDIQILEKSQQGCNYILSTRDWQRKYPLLQEKLEKLFERFTL